MENINTAPTADHEGIRQRVNDALLVLFGLLVTYGLSIL